MLDVIRRLLGLKKNNFEDNTYIGESPTVKHERQHRHEHDRQKRPRQEPQHTQVHGTIENQPDIHGRIRLAVRQNRVLHEQASSSLGGVKPVWDEVDWSSKTTPKPDTWQDEVDWS